jgi:metallophosphoesterase (TIGR00282 family)
MTIGFIGDIVGKPGREIIARRLTELREKFNIDFVIGNYENASHGFGLSEKNAIELFGTGIDMMSGGNHSFDKKEIIGLFDKYPLIRPLNYPKAMPGNGIFRTTILGQNLAIINIMGHYTMPMVDNPFVVALEAVDKLISDGTRYIIIDIHAEASSEKQALLHILKDKVSAILGTHTHVGSDDLQIFDGCCFVTDVGLTGCRNGVIGMDKKAPIKRFLTGVGEYFDIPNDCKAILQMIVFTLDSNGRCVEAKKIKCYDDEDFTITGSRFEIS